MPFEISFTDKNFLVNHKKEKGRYSYWKYFEHDNFCLYTNVCYTIRNWLCVSLATCLWIICHVCLLDTGLYKLEVVSFCKYWKNTKFKKQNSIVYYDNLRVYKFNSIFQIVKVYFWVLKKANYLFVTIL